MLRKLVLIAKEIKSDHLNKGQLFTDPFFRAMKVLGRLGTLSRNNAWQVEVMEERPYNQCPIEVRLESFSGGPPLTVEIEYTECVRCATDLLT
jgi:hypothetical protein